MAKRPKELRAEIVYKCNQNKRGVSAKPDDWEKLLKKQETRLSIEEMQKCQDAAFNLLFTTLQRWFPVIL